MKNSFILLLSCFIIGSGFAQKRVALHSNGNTTIYSGSQPFTDAYNDAVDGDTLYLPGGQFAGPNSYNKRLVIFGTGFRTDSSQVTGKTTIPSFTLQVGADNFHLEGVEVSGNISFSSNAKIDSVQFRRIKVNGSITIGGTNQDCEGIRIHECVILGTASLSNTSSPEITNSIMRFIANIENGYIANNIITTSGNVTTRLINNINQSLFENNYLANLYTNNYFMQNSSGNSFVNNAINFDPTAGATNNWSNNYTGIAPADLFIDYIYLFDEAANYGLQDPINYPGTTGNEIGLYGGYQPAKAGSIPANPHYQFKNIASQTNQNGELEVEITIEAQNE